MNYSWADWENNGAGAETIKEGVNLLVIKDSLQSLPRKDSNVFIFFLFFLNLKDFYVSYI